LFNDEKVVKAHPELRQFADLYFFEMSDMCRPTGINVFLLSHVVLVTLITMPAREFSSQKCWLEQDIIQDKKILSVTNSNKNKGH
jgi:hypothetical protein